MSDTVFTDINPDTWTQVSIGDIGYVTNSGDRDVIYVEATSTPPASLEIGHTLHPKEARTYNLPEDQEMYARTSQTVFPVAVTPGLGFGELGPFFNNLEQVLLVSAARTATTVSPDFVNTNAKGAHFVINVSAIVSTPQIQVIVQGKDSISGEYYNILISPVYTVVGTNIIKVYPGLDNVPNISISDILPRTFRVLVAHTNTDSITYSISAALS